MLLNYTKESNWNKKSKYESKYLVNFSDHKINTNLHISEIDLQAEQNKK